MASVADCSLLRSLNVGNMNLEQFYERLIVKHLRQPSHILPYLYLDMKTHDEILNKESFSPEEATKLMLQALQKKYNDDEWLTILKEGLCKEGFEKLHEYLSLDVSTLSERIKDHKQLENLLVMYFDVLIAVRADEVLPILVQKRVISKRDMEEVCSSQCGETKAMQILLLKLSKHPDSIVQLISALKKSNYVVLLEAIDDRLIEADSSMSIRRVITTHEPSTSRLGNRRSSQGSAGINTHRTTHKSKSSAREHKSQQLVQSASTRKYSPNKDIAICEGEFQLMSLPSSDDAAAAAVAAGNLPSKMTTVHLLASANNDDNTYTFSSGQSANGANGSVNKLSHEASDKVALYDKTAPFAANIGINIQSSDDNGQVHNCMANDLCASMIENVMNEIEDELKSRSDIHKLMVEVPEIGNLVLFSASRGTADYSKCATILVRETAKIFDQNARIFFQSCSRHLLAYNKALMIHMACHSKYAVDYIKSEIQKLSSNHSMSYDETGRTERWLDKLFTDLQEPLEQIVGQSDDENPALRSLENQILAHEGHGIVICPSNEIARYVVMWMKEKPHLASLRPLNISPTLPEGASINGRPTLDIAKHFRPGVVPQVIVVSHDAVNGSDLRNCGADYCLNYEGKVLVSVTARPDVAVAALSGPRGGSGVVCAPVHDRDTYELSCANCSDFAILSSDLRTIEHRHHVSAPGCGFEDRITVEPHPCPKRQKDWEKKEKIYCAKCHHDWGVRAAYKGVPYCVLTAHSFCVVGRGLQEKKYFKDWQQFPFSVMELTAG